MIALLLLACGAPELALPLAPPRAAVERQVVARRVGTGEAVLFQERLSWAEGWTAPEGALVVEGLEVALVDEQVGGTGDRHWRTRTWSLAGEDGSYHVPAATLRFVGEGDSYRDVPAAAVDFDIGVEGPTSDLKGLMAPPVPAPFPWKKWLAAGVGVLGILALGLWAWRRFQRRRNAPPPPIPLPPPDEEALEAWARLQANLDLDDHARAVGLSCIFRRYLERALEGVLATTWTRREILRALEALDLDGELLGRSRNVLSATDALKFARRGGGERFFSDLDQDFHRVIESTRPQPLQEERVGA